MKAMKTTILMVIITIIGILLGFIRESVTVGVLGAGWQADSFIYSVMFPTMIFASIGGVISSIFMPIYTSIRINESLTDANKFASNFICIITIIVIILIFIGEIFTKNIVMVLAPGFSGDGLELTSKLIRIILPTMILMTSVYVSVGILSSFKDIILNAAISIPIHLMVILSLLLIYPRYGMYDTMIIIAFGSVLQFLMFIPKLRKKGFVFSISFDFKNKHIKEAVYMIGPMIIGTMAIQVNMMVDRGIASTIGDGVLTTVNLANKLNMASYNSIAFIIIMMIFPVLSEQVAHKDMKQFSKTLTKSISIIISIMLPITIILNFFRYDIINLLFGYGKFTKQDVMISANILSFYSLGLCFLGIRDILNRAFYSFKDTKTSMKNGVLAVGLNIVLSIIFSKIIGAKGLALGTSVSTIFVSILLIRSMKKKVVEFKIRDFILNSFKVIIAGSILCCSLVVLQNLTIELGMLPNSKLHSLFYLLVNVLVSLSIYFIALILLKLDVLDNISGKIMLKFRGNREKVRER
ncbi:murein biosynthesis integral membrane protein MurJ [Oceanirhabdus seepicola]|uniref:Probable lipid II flippase MurJ n=1 Tax=Oceanirhabdus seepicola TaxID=2828781 RepID=A0A9J6P386_9CLOT|nr:murein biosynthesis integral membrane protein MurJ [Oceanirhabdus seepicola]MCM1990505.1 murein biosynthesis integral membrane protein MurJ [Oceanirhabdus seepicola]